IVVGYGGGSQKIFVPANLPVIITAEANRSVLVRGSSARIYAKVGADGKLTAVRVQVSLPVPPSSCDSSRTRPCTMPVWYATTRKEGKSGYGKERIEKSDAQNYGVAGIQITK